MKRKKTILLSIVLAALGIFFLLPAVGFSILKWGVLPPEKLTPLVIEKTNEFIEAHLECERIELTYFETYPYLGVALTRGRLISHQAEEADAHEEELAIPSDSLLSFQKAVVVFNPTDYLFGGKITIKRVWIDAPRFYGYVNKAGKANWDIYQSLSDEADSLAADSLAKPLPPIDLQKVAIRNGHFIYNDRQEDLYAEIDGFSLRIDGSLTYGENKLDIEGGISSLVWESPAYTLSNKLSLQLKSRVLLNRPARLLTLKGAELRVNNLPFTADGSIGVSPLTGRTAVDMEMGLDVSDMNDLLRFIPDAYFRNRDKTIAQGSILVKGTVRGELGDSVVPNVDLCCQIKNGAYHIEGIKQGIDTLQMDVDLHLNGRYPDSSFVSLEELTLKGLDTSLRMEAKVSNLFRNPAIRTAIKGKVDFTRLGEEFLNPDTLLLQGILEADLHAAFTVNDLVEGRYGKVKSSGKLYIDRFKAYSRPLELDAYISGANLFAGAIDKESKYLDTNGLLNATLSIDTLNISYGKEIRTEISQLEMAANTTPVIDTTAVIPLTARMEFGRLQSRLPDSTWLVAGHTVMMGGIKASASDKRMPTAGAVIRTDTLKYFLIPVRTGMVMAGSVFTIEALPMRDVWQQRRQKRAQEGVASQGAGRRKRTAAGAIRPQTVDTTNASTQWLRRWETRGHVQFDQFRMFSRLMPLPIRMEKTKLAFTTNQLTLTDARLHLGKSDLMLNGEIKQIRQALLRGGKLKGEFTLTSDLIDCNQLMKALNSGMQYSEQLAVSQEAKPFDEDSIAGINAEAFREADELAEGDTTTQLLVVPRFLDMALHTRAREIRFQDLELKEVEGEVIVRDQSINLSNLKMHSNIGEGRLTMAYTAKDKGGATAGFDLDMKDILVNKLIGLFPSMDTLVPMLRSFEGVVDCQMTATCRMDSTLSVVLPSVQSACYLSGKNMVLLDGETFAEISKTLMFKNKKRNVIDSIAVDVAVHDNKIEVFPFLVEMDRYRVAVGGTHNLDMTFNYHISVLKSPVPFKLGIDITGNLDDFKFKITKCKYKDLFKPAKQAELDSTRRNVRETVREAVRKQIRETAPELAASLPVGVSSGSEARTSDFAAGASGSEAGASGLATRPAGSEAEVPGNALEKPEK